MRASILYPPDDDVKLILILRYFILVLSMIIYQLTNINDKFIIIKWFSWVFDFILYRRVV
jgi:hypothetical protein